MTTIEQRVVKAFAEGTITSADGTTIGYRHTGAGPGLVAIHGALESSRNYLDLATTLAGEFSVYVPDRRGRGMSGPHGDDYTLAKEVADIRALIAQTGATYLFGVSSGAIIALETALTVNTIRKVIAYEPALSIPEYDTNDFVSRYEQEISDGKTADAIITVLKGAEMGPRWLRILPRWVGRRLISMLIAEDEAKATQGETTFTSLVPTLHYDFIVSDEGSRDISRYATLQQDVLLLGGSKSPRYLKAALDVLEKIVPHVQRSEFSGFDHVSSGNASEGGKPTIIAAAIMRFLQEKSQN